MRIKEEVGSNESCKQVGWEADMILHLFNAKSLQQSRLTPSGLNNRCKMTISAAAACFAL